ncbi:unnamed protein product [Miscanthus lutarioriparius]|uniref:Uncharacterized protein n=1 Tax=Miscanthus lutarioriparius TaxID=422564 RepID=A0A811SHN5_9POAL|nr:unnamed protein product [Miscanthus lutarioriparius]
MKAHSTASPAHTTTPTLPNPAALESPRLLPAPQHRDATTTTAASDDGRPGGAEAARAVKETTGIVGLEVVPNAREVLIGLYTRTLKEIEAVPKDEGYRKAVESFTNHRLQICQEEDDWKRIEDRIECGQVEELIEEAEDELKLIAKMVEWDPWGVPDDYECEVIEDDTPIPKHVPQHQPVALPEEFFKTLDAVKSDPRSPRRCSSSGEGVKMTLPGYVISHFAVLSRD